MKTFFLLSGIILCMILVQCKDVKKSSEIITINSPSNSLRVERFTKLAPQLKEIDSLIGESAKDYSPNFMSWNKGNRLLQSFVSNQDINLFKGDYVRDIFFQPHIDGHKYRFIVNIQYPWMDTEIELHKGKTYYIMVSGIASTSNCKTTLWIGPEGKKDLYNNLPYYSVIGRLGKDKPFFIGKEKEITPIEDGKFFIGYNDDLYVDNIGYYVVDVFEVKKETLIERLKTTDIILHTYYTE